MCIHPYRASWRSVTASDDFDKRADDLPSISLVINCRAATAHLLQYRVMDQHTSQKTHRSLKVNFELERFGNEEDSCLETRSASKREEVGSDGFVSRVYIHVTHSLQVLGRERGRFDANMRPQCTAVLDRELSKVWIACTHAHGVSQNSIGRTVSGGLVFNSLNICCMENESDL